MSNATKITLEEIIRRKQEVKDAINIQKQTIGKVSHELFTPFIPKTHKSNVLIRSFNIGIALFEGVMWGVKLMRKVRVYFRK